MMPKVLNAQKNKPFKMPLYDSSPYHYGYVIGLNQMLFSIDYKDIENATVSDAIAPGFTVGIVGNLRLAKHLDLRLIPTYSFGTRVMTYNNKNNRTTYPSLFELPLQIKYRSKRNFNQAAYVIAGTNYKFDVIPNNRHLNNEGQPKELLVKRNDIAAEIGAGFDFYTGYFKFGIELKMSYGLRNLIKDEYANSEYLNQFDKLRSKTFYILLTFE